MVRDTDRATIQRDWKGAFFTLCWGLNVALWIGAVAWLCTDGDSDRQLANEYRQIFRELFYGARSLPRWHLHAFLCVAWLTLIITLGGLIVGNPRQRSIKRWLGGMFLCALWIVLLQNAPTIAWYGKAYRLRSLATELRPLVGELSRNWPEGDGRLNGMGDFMAYPRFQPRMLLALTKVTGEDNPMGIAAVERVGGETYCIEIPMDWNQDFLEYHADHSRPGSFVGGLSQRYQLVRYISLGEDWYLVRYDRDALNAED